METIINAPAGFVLPIPKGILENSITAQSAIATPLQAGGTIVRSGPIFAHAGERIIPANNQMSNTGGTAAGLNLSVNINGSNSNPQEIADKVINEVNKIYRDQSQRRGSYIPRFQR